MPEPTAPDERDAKQVKPFAAFLQEQRAGVLHAELSDTLAEIVAAAIEHDKPGSVTLKITVTPDADGAVKVSDDWSAKKPRQTSRASLFFADEHGNLSRRNPRQPELPLRPVAGGASNDNAGGHGAAKEA